jgi:hypothetical protein
VNVRTTFADALAAQQESLKGVLAELESSFRRDLAERARFEQLTKDAIARVEKLAAVTSVGDATLRQATVEATAALGRALADNAVQSAANREGLDDLRRTLAASLSAAAEAHRDFLKKEDSNLESVLGKLYGLVDEIARTTRAVQERANGGGIDARA